MGKEWRMFILCWFAYASAYLCRTNLSIAAPKMLETFNWSKSNIGLIAGIFFWTYAVGQLVNGYIGDKVRSRPFIFVSLASASIINIIMGFSKVKWSFIILWGMNGFFLSMLWGPILRILSFWFPPEKGTRVGMGISTSSTVGYLVSWGLLGQLIANTSWQWAFWVPGIFVLLFSFIWLFRVPEHPGYGL